MESFYLYGAGVNCISAIRFFGAGVIEGIIDGNEALHGNNILGIPIISLDEYISAEKDLPVLITPYYAGREIFDELKRRRIKRVFKAPWMQNDLFSGISNVADALENENKNQIVFNEKDPISDAVGRLLQKRGQEVIYGLNAQSKVNGNSVYVLTLKDQWEKEAIYEKFPNYNIIFFPERVQEYSRENCWLKKYKDIHKDERCVIVGNGPSVRVDDLDALYNNGEICFGVNRVYLGFTQTKWRPNYYVTVDEKLAIDGLQGVMNYEFPKFVRKINGVTDKIQEIELFDSILQPLDGFGFSDDVSHGIYMGHTVVFETVQIAAYMGFKEIYLIGVDMTLGINYQDDGAHFYKSPDKNEALGKGDPLRAIGYLSEASMHLKGKNISLYNATRNVWWKSVPIRTLDCLK